ncbi:DUF4843 domain-containing protein [Prevotella sp. oral taxon 376]|uniref:DUF4843 domain-containing protein n=1 Tax=Prevotella sp. oral taxon 376 TaxID=712466 RepID=UPI000D1E3F9A|nr:DUF4843 domain-containing protein [Prevotella sp. oral taxon 376]PTL33903.1 DUF4843 domain-containing protein [Prevotella sp. oral taxon 376]
MKKILFYIPFVALILSCSKDEINTYNESKDAVRFAANIQIRSHETDSVNGSYMSVDSLLECNFSFIEYPDSESFTYDIPLTLIGKIADHDRIVKYKVESKSNAADYEIKEALIPAKKYTGHIRVILKNTTELNDTTYQLFIQLLSSADLKVGPSNYSKAKLTWNNQIPYPPHNNLRRSYNMLVYSTLNFVSTSAAIVSPNALRAIVAATGWNDWDNTDIHGNRANGPAYGYYKYLPQYRWIYTGNSYKGYAAKLGDYLMKYKKEHGSPLLHDAGSYKGQPIQARTY